MYFDRPRHYCVLLQDIDSYISSKSLDYESASARTGRHLSCPPSSTARTISATSPRKSAISRQRARIRYSRERSKATRRRFTASMVAQVAAEWMRRSAVERYHGQSHRRVMPRRASAADARTGRQGRQKSAGYSRQRREPRRSDGRCEAAAVITYFARRHDYMNTS